MSKARKNDQDPDMREEYDFSGGVRGKYAGRVSPLRIEVEMEIRVTAVFQEVPEGFIAYVEELPGANTQGVTFEEAQANLEEAVALVLEAHREARRQLAPAVPPGTTVGSQGFQSLAGFVTYDEIDVH